MIAEFQEKVSLEELVMRMGALQSVRPLTKTEFYELAARFPDLQLEREKTGKITVMSPVKKGSNRRESTLFGLLFMWQRQTGLGEIYSATAGFELPDTSIKSPDAAWISDETLKQFQGKDDEESFVRTVPDFVIEVRSSTDRLAKLQKKMTDTWLKNGVRLGWLVDPYKEKIYIYRRGKNVEILEGFDGRTLSAGDLMPGFRINLEELKPKSKNDQRKN